MNNILLGLMIISGIATIYWVLFGEKKQKEMLK